VKLLQTIPTYEEEQNRKDAEERRRKEQGAEAFEPGTGTGWKVALLLGLLLVLFIVGGLLTGDR
jgi:hypothetical protein